MSKKLTPKRELFIHEYLIDLNATQAAIRAGYSKKTAYSIGEEILKIPEVRDAINKAKLERVERTKVTADQVVKEIERVAMIDPARLIRVYSPQDIEKLPEDVRRAITGWHWDKGGNFTLELEKTKGLEMLGRHHKLFTDKVEITDKSNLAEKMRKGRERVKAGGKK